MNIMLAIAGAFMAIVGIVFLTGVGMSPERPLSLRRRRLLGLGFLLLAVSFILQALGSGSTLLLLGSALLAFAAVAAFVWSIMVGRQEKQRAM